MRTIKQTAVFVELPPFRKHRDAYLSDADYLALQNLLLADPTAAMNKRNLYSELQEGMSSLAAEREGKITLRKFSRPLPADVDLSPEDIKSIREAARCSQAVMAHRLRVNPRTYQNWEQGKAKPNAQAAILIRLVAKHPETLHLLETL
jgi:putative transcriptional regulator